MKLQLFGAIALMLLTPATASARQAGRADHTLAWMSIEVADIERAKRFYVDALGMKQVLVLSKPADPFQKLGFNFSGDPASGEPLLILIHYDRASPDRKSTRGAMLGLLVADVRAAAARVRSAGYVIEREPAEGAAGPILTVIARDPDGMIVEITQLLGPVSGK